MNARNSALWIPEADLKLQPQALSLWLIHVGLLEPRAPLRDYGL